MKTPRASERLSLRPPARASACARVMPWASKLISSLRDRRAEGGEAQRLGDRRHHVAGLQRDVLPRVADHGLQRHRVEVAAAGDLHRHLVHRLANAAGGGQRVEQALPARREGNLHAVADLADHRDGRRGIAHPPHQDLGLVGLAPQAARDLLLDVGQRAPRGGDLAGERNVDEAVAVDHLLRQRDDTRSRGAAAQVRRDPAREQRRRRRLPDVHLDRVAGADGHPARRRRRRRGPRRTGVACAARAGAGRRHRRPSPTGSPRRRVRAGRRTLRSCWRSGRRSGSGCSRPRAAAIARATRRSRCMRAGKLSFSRTCPRSGRCRPLRGRSPTALR